MLTHDESVVSFWLCRDAYAIYRCPYPAYERQLFKPNRSFAHRTNADTERKITAIQTAEEIDFASYLPRLRKGQATVRELARSKMDPSPANAEPQERFVFSGRSQKLASALVPSSKSRQTRTAATLLDDLDFRDRSTKPIVLMEYALTDEPTRAA